MLFFKKPAVSTKVYFTVYPCSGGWEVCLDGAKPDKTSAPFILKPDVIIRYHSESDTELAKTIIRFDDSTVEIKAAFSSDETHILGAELYGYDQNKRLVVSFEEGNSCIRIAREEVQNAINGIGTKDFKYQCSTESIVFSDDGCAVMELHPAFNTNRIGTIQIKGWIKESHLMYLPYLSGLLGYSKLL